VRAVSEKYEPLKPLAEIKTFNPTMMPTNSPQENATVLELSAILETWCGAARRCIKDHAIETGEIPPSYNLVPTKERPVIGWAQAQTVARKWGVPQETIDRATTISITPLKKDVASRADRGDKTGYVDEFDQDLASAGVFGPAVPTVTLRKSRTKTKKND
jgi:hypothetical protein